MKKFLVSAIAGSFLFADNFINLKITNNTIMPEAQIRISLTQPIYARGGALINDKKDNFYYVGLKTEGEMIGTDVPVNFGLFVDYVYVKDNSALPIGVSADSYLKNFSMPVFVRGEFEYAPKILSFKNADKFLKVQVEAGIRFIENGEVFAGYRNISFDSNYNSSFYGGVGFVF